MYERACKTLSSAKTVTITLIDKLWVRTNADPVLFARKIWNLFEMLIAFYRFFT